MIGYWIEDNLEWLLGLALVVLLVGGITWVIYKADSEHDRNCAALYAMAHTSHDSLEVAMRCTLGDGSSTTVIPVVVPVR